MFQTMIQLKHVRAARGPSLLLSAALGLACGAPVVIAATPSAIKLQTEVLQETQVASAGATAGVDLVPASRLTAGSEVIYRVSYTNTSEEPAQVVITNPLPPELLYLHEPSVGSAGASLEVSVDGGQRFGELSQLRLTAPGGPARAATVADVTHVRWVLDKPLQPGEAGQVSLRARIR